MQSTKLKIRLATFTHSKRKQVQLVSFWLASLIKVLCENITYCNIKSLHGHTCWSLVCHKAIREHFATTLPREVVQWLRWHRSVYVSALLGLATLPQHRLEVRPWRKIITFMFALWLIFHIKCRKSIQRSENSCFSLAATTNPCSPQYR